MPRRPRIDLAGYHHVINRGVEKREIFIDHKDYDTFLVLLCKSCMKQDATIHSFCLMNNHYHLLIQTQKENLSKLMRAINAEYASYFNRKYKRVGHLWQGRFKSWFITDEAYLYTLIKYIEFNPLKAKMVNSLYDYKYGSFQMFCGSTTPIPCLKESLILNMFKTQNEREEFFESWYDEDILKEIRKSSNLVVSSVVEDKLSKDLLQAVFSEGLSREERNIKVLETLQKGYSQQDIAAVLGISQPAVSQIIKKLG